MWACCEKYISRYNSLKVHTGGLEANHLTSQLIEVSQPNSARRSTEVNQPGDHVWQHLRCRELGIWWAETPFGFEFLLSWQEFAGKQSSMLTWSKVKWLSHIILHLHQKELGWNTLYIWRYVKIFPAFSSWFSLQPLLNTRMRSTSYAVNRQ